MTAQQAFLAARGREDTRTRRRRLALAVRCALALLLSAAILPVGAAQLDGLALQTAPGGAQLVLKMSGAAGARLFRLKSPERAVLDLDNTQLAPGVSGPRAGGIVQAVRVGRQPRGVLRVVLQLTGNYPAHAAWSSGPAGRRLLIVSVGAPPASSSAAGRAAASRPPVSSVSPPAAYSSNNAPPAHEAVPASAAAESSQGVTVEPLPADAVSVEPIPGEDAAAESAESAQPAHSAQSARVAPVAIPDPGPRPVRPAHAPGTAERDIIVAVDAGHGGVDPGAIGHGGTREKDVTLAIASLLAARINREPGMRAILTRSSDEFVVLRDRIQRARAAKADMFVSVHADAARNPEASGASVYVLSEKGASNENARWLAERENAADLIGGVKLDNKDRTLASVLLDLSQTETISSSIEAAQRVLACLDGVEEVRRSEVQQAGFVVLKSPDIPSMLVETAYISNPQDEARLRRPAEQQRLAEAIFTGVRRYFVAKTRLSALSRSGTPPRPSS